MDHIAAPFAAWENFYVITGSSAGALIGLQFVVIVLAAEKGVLSEKGTVAFATPTIVHFCATLFLSAVASAPWGTVSGASACLAFLGIAGLLYLARTAVVAHRQRDYIPVAEDWIWYFIFPALAYLIVTAGAMALLKYPEGGSFLSGAASLALLFVAIHNAWDGVTHIAMSATPQK